MANINWLRVSAAIVGALIAIYATQCGMDNTSELHAQRELGVIKRDVNCRPPGIILAIGDLQRATDNSHVYYVGGITLIPGPKTNGEIQLQALMPNWVAKERRFKLILVEEPLR